MLNRVDERLQFGCGQRANVTTASGDDGYSDPIRLSSDDSWNDQHLVFWSGNLADQFRQLRRNGLLPAVFSGQIPLLFLHLLVRLIKCVPDNVDHIAREHNVDIRRLRIGACKYQSDIRIKDQRSAAGRFGRNLMCTSLTILTPESDADSEVLRSHNVHIQGLSVLHGLSKIIKCHVSFLPFLPSWVIVR